VHLWPFRGPPGPSRPGLGRARGPEDRLTGPDPRIISRLARGQSCVLLIERESSDAIAKSRGWLSGSSCRVSGWSSRWRGESRGLAGVWRTKKGRINRPRRAGPDLAPCIGVKPARPVYENTCRIARERLVVGIATQKGQVSRGPGPGHEIGSHSTEERLAGARLGLAQDSWAQRWPVTAWSRIRCTSLHFPFSCHGHGVCQVSISRASQQLHLPSEVIAPRPSLLVFVGV
jgi:hypothetical protein